MAEGGEKVACPEVQAVRGIQRSAAAKIPQKATKNKSRGASLRGQGTPAYPARLRSERARNSTRKLCAQRGRKHFL